MALFKCTPEELAKYFAENPQTYKFGFSFLKRLGRKDVFSDELENSLDSEIAFLKSAFEISTNASWFAFNVYDSWAERVGVKSEGVELYQKVNNGLVLKLGLDSNGVPEIRTAINMLQRNNIQRVYTLNPPEEGYLGLERLSTDGDGDIVKRTRLDDFELGSFKRYRIEVSSE